MSDSPAAPTLPAPDTPAPWRRWWIAGLEAGAAVGLIDAFVAMGRTGVSRYDRWLFPTALMFLTAGVLGVLGALAAVLTARAARLAARWQGALVQAAGITVGFLAGFALFSGTAMRRAPARPWAILATAAFATFAVQTAWAQREAITRWTARHRRVTQVLLLTASAAVYLVHAFAFVRLYAGLHAFAAVSALASLVIAVALGVAADLAFPPVRLVLTTVMLLAVGAGVLGTSQARRGLARARAPIGGYLATALGTVLPAPVGVGTYRSARAATGRSLDSRGRDVVLVTVDALRADSIGVYGGPAGLTPAIDALAHRGYWFDRAYCSTPHTSYSLASIMTGKHFRDVSALGDALRPHDTLASLLRRAGYRTAGYYPPAVFNVDGERLGDLRARAFDFETHDESWEGAPARVASATRWLTSVPVTDHVFLWVHLFEPHEPYEPHPGGRTGPRGDYDAEVGAVDDAIGQLMASFRARGRDPLWIVTADHGEEFGEHGGRYHGTTLYEEQVRVPLVIAPPETTEHEIGGPVSLVDLMPTVLSSVGLARPPRLAGRDLGPLVLGDAPASDVFASVGTLRMLARGTLRLLVDTSEGSAELYDIARDADEHHTLADERAGDLPALRGALDAWVRDQGAIEREGQVAEQTRAHASLDALLLGDAHAAVDLARGIDTLDGATARRATIALANAALSPADEATLRDVLARWSDTVRARDPSLARAASVARFVHGDATAHDDTVAALGDDDLARLAAVALAHVGDDRGEAVLSRVARDPNAIDRDRASAVYALERLGARHGFDTFVTLLGDPTWSPEAARVLGGLGDARARDPLAAAVQNTPYALARRAALGALVQLGDSRATALLGDALGSTDPLPNPWPLVSALHEPGVHLAGRARSIALGPGVTLVSVAGPVPTRVAWVWLAITNAGEATTLRVGEHEAAVTAGESTLRVMWEHPTRSLPVAVVHAASAGSPHLTIHTLLVVPRVHSQGGAP